MERGKGEKEADRGNRYWTYQIARAMQALTMGQNTRSLAEAHARQIIKAEVWLGIDIELGLQKVVMAHPWVLAFFNKSVASLALSSKGNVMTDFMKDLRHGTHPSDYRIYGLRLLCLSPTDIPVDPPHTRPIQLPRLYHLLLLALYAS